MAMSRRTVIAAIGAGLLGSPFPSHSAPAPGTRRLGIFYFADSKPASGDYFPGFREVMKELAKLGWVEGNNLILESRFASIPAEISTRASELVRSGVDAIITEGTSQTRGVQQATKTIPIVTGVGDPVGGGFAKSLARPGGNVTGISFASAETPRKQLEVLRAMVPGLSRLAILTDGENPASPELARPIQAAAQESGIVPELVLILGIADIQRALQPYRGVGVRAARIFSGSGFDEFIEAKALAALAIRNKVPTMFNDPNNVEAGGLLSFNLVHENQAQRSAAQLDKVLRGVNPAEIPFELPTKSELVINRKTAKSLGLSIPPELLLRTDRVID